MTCSSCKKSASVWRQRLKHNLTDDTIGNSFLQGRGLCCDRHVEGQKTTHVRHLHNTDLHELSGDRSFILNSHMTPTCTFTLAEVQPNFDPMLFGGLTTPASAEQTRFGRAGRGSTSEPESTFMRKRSETFPNARRLTGERPQSTNRCAERTS